jgi:hypothetical protein
LRTTTARPAFSPLFHPGKSIGKESIQTTPDATFSFVDASYDDSLFLSPETKDVSP